MDEFIGYALSSVTEKESNPVLLGEAVSWKDRYRWRDAGIVAR